MLLDGAQVGHRDGARGADPPQVVADQVHDHDVLGVVLLQQVVLGPAGALDRSGLDGAAAAAQEQLGRGSGDLDAVSGQPDRSGVRRRVAAGQQGGQRVHVGARVDGRREHAAEVGLIDLAGGYVRADAPYARRVRGAVERRRPVADGGAAPRSRPGRGHRLGPYVREACAGQAAFEVHADRPEALGVEGGGIARDVEETGGETVAEAGEGREVEHAVESRTVAPR
ncbi:hypothetical protein RKD48_006391 [Streptomyces ambofaciens]